MVPIILLPDPQMKRTRLYDLHPSSVPGFCGLFRFCGHSRNVFQGYERCIETAFARFQNAYRRYREEVALFLDRCRSQHSAPSGDSIPSRTIYLYKISAKAPLFVSPRKNLVIPIA